MHPSCLTKSEFYDRNGLGLTLGLAWMMQHSPCSHSYSRISIPLVKLLYCKNAATRPSHHIGSEFYDENGLGSSPGSAWTMQNSPSGHSYPNISILLVKSLYHKNMATCPSHLIWSELYNKNGLGLSLGSAWMMQNSPSSHNYPSISNLLIKSL